MKLEIATSLIAWFDPQDIHHLRAYNHLQETGTWPERFLPENILFPVAWNTILAFKLADCYIKERLAKEGEKHE